MTPCEAAADDQPPALPAGTHLLTRRDWVRTAGVGVSSTVLAGLAPAAGAAGAATTYPQVKVADLDALQPDVPVPFSYPDASSPAVLVRLRAPAAGGVGPGQSVVAFSVLCTHKGCPVSYKPERKLLICPCHWSSFDPTRKGQMVIGQASEPLPQIRLRVEGNAVFAVGVDGLIFGRHTNVL